MEVLLIQHIRGSKVLIEGLGRKTARPESKQSKIFPFSCGVSYNTLAPLLALPRYDQIDARAGLDTEGDTDFARVLLFFSSRFVGLLHVQE